MIMTRNNLIKEAKCIAPRPVWRQAGYLFAGSLVGIWKLIARRTLSEPTDESPACVKPKPC